MYYILLSKQDRLKKKFENDKKTPPNSSAVENRLGLPGSYFGRAFSRLLIATQLSLLLSRPHSKLRLEIGTKFRKRPFHLVIALSFAEIFSIF